MNIAEIGNKIETYYRLKALLVSPLAALIVFLPTFYLAPTLLSFDDETHIETIIGMLMLALITISITLPITIILGYPIFLSLHRIGILNGVTLTASGAILGGGIGFLIGKWTLCILFSFIGASVALAFWYIYNKRAPQHRLEHYEI